MSSLPSGHGRRSASAPMRWRLIPPPSQPVKSDGDLRLERESKIAELGRAGLLARSVCAGRCRSFVVRTSSRPLIATTPMRRSPCRFLASGPRSNTAQLSAVLRAARPERGRPVPRGWRGLGLRHVAGAGGSGSGGSGRGDRARSGDVRVRPGEPGWGYTDIILIHGDGGLGHSEHAPYDRICITAACPDVPSPLIEQLATPGRLIAPVVERARQRLTLLEKTADGVRREGLVDVLYVSLRGQYGAGGDPHG